MGMFDSGLQGLEIGSDRDARKEVVSVVDAYDEVVSDEEVMGCTAEMQI